MIPQHETKVVAIAPPKAISDNASPATAEIDTNGWDYLTIYIWIGALDIAMVAMHATESDATGSNHAEITGTDFTDATNHDIDGADAHIPADTDDNKLWAMDIDLRGRKRFIDLVLTTGDGSAGTFIAAWGVLSRGKELPVSSAERGCEQILRV